MRLLFIRRGKHKVLNVNINISGPNVAAPALRIVIQGEVMMKYLGLAFVFFNVLTLMGQSQADQGDWLVRIRAIDIQPRNQSDPIPGLGVPADAITLSDKLAPEIDLSYFLKKNIALELILTYPQEHDVSLNGVKIGTAKHLPPTLTVQYHFIPDGKFRPYLGAGINYTHFSDVDLNVPGVGQLALEKDSWGGALQAGFDIEIHKNRFINFDVKKIYIGSDVKLAANGAKVSHIRLDPVVIGIGFGWRF